MKPQTQILREGSKVTFDNDQAAAFINETNTGDKALLDYRNLVLAGADQVGVVIEPGESLSTIAYPDGWQLPVPNKYLLVLEEQ